MAGATAPSAHRTYRVGASRIVAFLTIATGALLPLAKASSWGTTPLPPPPPVQQPLPSSGGSAQDSRLQVGRLQPGDVVSLQVIPYRE